MSHDWLSSELAKWRDQIIKEGLGEVRLMRLSGLSHYKARILLKAVRDELYEEPDLVEEFDEDEEDVPETPSTKKAIDDHDLLCHDDYVYNQETDTYITFTRSTGGKPMVMSGEKHRAIIQAYSNWDGRPATINQICRDFYIPRPWLIEYLRIHGITHDSEPFSREDVESRDVDEMVEEALQAKRQQVYRKYETAKWKDTQDAADKWHSFNQTVLQEFLLHMEGVQREYEIPTIELDEADSPYALVLSPTDFHWGMYSWRHEVDDPYDFSVAERRLMEHTANIFGRLPGQPEKIYIAVGSDFFHCDGQTASTTKGTPLDIAASPTEIMVTGCRLTRVYIDLARQIAPVEVIFMPGNHDQHNTRCLMMYLQAWYRNDDDVRVPDDWRSRVYRKYGSSLIGFHHGDGTKVSELSACMSKEARSLWSSTDWHIWFGGHLHTHHVQESGAIIHYQLPSLAGHDRWHSNHGYVTSDPSLVAYLIDHDGGPVSWLRSAESISERDHL